MMSTSLVVSTSEVVDMLCTKTSIAIVLLDGALTIDNEADRPTICALKGVGINMAVLPCKALHLLQDGLIAEIRPERTAPSR